MRYEPQGSHHYVRIVSATTFPGISVEPYLVIHLLAPKFVSLELISIAAKAFKNLGRARWSLCPYYSPLDTVRAIAYRAFGVEWFFTFWECESENVSLAVT